MMVSEKSGPPPAPGRNGSRAVRWAYLLFPLVLLPLMLVLSRDFGITWDERTHQQYGQRVYGFLEEGRDNDWFRPGKINMYLHGGFFDAACIGVQKVLKGDLWTDRHYLNAFFGWLAILYAGRIGRLLGGPGTGLLAMILLVVSPRFFADAMTNPKDIPFAALATAALYYLLRLEPRYPFLRWHLAIPLVLSMGLALNVRAGAILFLAYFGLALAALTFARRDFAPRHLAATAGRWVAVAAGTLLVGVAFWPWARSAPFTRPFEAIQRLSQYPWPDRVLYNGLDLTGETLPWDYVPRWALMGTPPVVLLGAALSLLLLLHLRARADGKLLAVWGAALFPPVYVVVTDATIYDGIRHLTFAYLPLVVLAAWAWVTLLRSPTRAVSAVAAGVLALGLLEPAVFQWRNHPHQAVYFNFTVGGPRGAFGRFEVDYWGRSVRAAVRYAAERAEAADTRLVVSGHPHHLVRDETRRVDALDYERIEKEKHHLEVVLLRGPRESVLGFEADPEALARINAADGAPLSVVMPGPRYAEIAEAATPEGDAAPEARGEAEPQ